MKTPCTILTGFLGAGKTSLLRHLLEQPQGRRLAVIINEFGDVGIDRDIIRGCAIESCPEDAIVELANGCLCCTVADDFVPALTGLLNRAEPPDHILIETSGLALPKPLIRAFNWPDIQHRVTVDGVITLVDGAAVAAGRFADDPEEVARQRQADSALDHDNPLEEVFEDQLLSADLVIINKADLLDTDTLAQVEAEVRTLLPRPVKIVSGQHGRIDPTILLGLTAAAEADLAARPSHHDAEEDHDHEDFDSFILELPEQEQPAALVARLVEVIAAHDILRVKGFVPVQGKAMRLLVQGVGTRLQHGFDRPWTAGEARIGRLVVIGRHGLDRDAIRAALAA